MEVLTQRYEDKRVVVDKHVENLFNLPKVSQENASNLRKIIDTCTKNVEALKHQNLPVDGLGEQMLVNLIAGKMDKKLRVAWEARQTKNVLSTYPATMDFLEDQCRIYEKLDTCTKPSAESAKLKTMARSHTLISSESKTERNEHKCQVCKANHELWKCEAFKNKTVSEKYDLLKKCGACFNCFGRGHRTNACSSSHSCRECGKRHHTTLHENNGRNIMNRATIPVESTATPVVEPDVNSTTAIPAGTMTTLCARASEIEKQTLLSTAIVLVDGLASTPYPCRVLLDSASQMNFVTERFANLLSLKMIPADFTVSGLNSNKTRIGRMLHTTVRSCHTNLSIDLDLLVTAKITGDLPVKSFDVSGWPISSKLALADPTFNKRGRVDMLIGAEYFWSLLEEGRFELGTNLPTLSNTKLGWIAGGIIRHDAPIIAHTFCQTISDESLIELLRSFYSVEACDEIRPTEGVDEDMCLEHFRQTHQRTKEGRYVVRHPFNERKNELGSSREMALKRFLHLERKLERQPELKEQYSQFIAEYEQLGHMREIQEEPNENVGSVGIHPQDASYQRIFWRYNRNDPLTVRELLTVTYGLGPSPFQATMALRQTAVDHKDEFPEAAKIFERGTYMDDILTGADTLPKACQLQRDVTELLAKGCFGAHKWCANHSDIVQNIPEELRGNSFEVTDDNSKTMVKTLGVAWNPIQDWFSVSVPDYDDMDGLTRRRLLSQLAKIFDPLGFFGPVITTAKLILREVGDVGSDVGSKWRRFRIEMKMLQQVQLPRWISWNNSLKLELHGFADASDSAYGACLWKYIPTNENPADLISRGEHPKKLIESNIWWNGPSMLNCLSVAEKAEEAEMLDEELPELRSGVVLTATAPVERLSIFDKVSSFLKIVRSMAYLTRFLNYIMSKKKNVIKGSLTADEISKSILLIVRLIQQETFKPEILALMSGENTKHRLNGLKAFIDPEDGILRVGGRLKRAFIPYDSRHQMLLPSTHPVTEALIQYLHLENSHIGQKGLLAIVRQRY
ncbi:uncharacterized protein LOC134221497 [Armigeres subalbatus]|uniref:uncharacterized protein LOC134221497 n=1 Tax=Armigeres subalbatus TaxID=124917 RepID=UPI002ED2DB18